MSFLTLIRRILAFLSGKSRSKRYKKGRSDEIYPLF